MALKVAFGLSRFCMGRATPRYPPLSPLSPLPPPTSPPFLSSVPNTLYVVSADVKPQYRFLSD